MSNFKTVARRGHQHHVRFSGNRSSNVNAEQVLAALRAGYRLSITQLTISNELMQDTTTVQKDTSNVMKDPYKLAWLNTGLIDPDIIVAKCERFGPVKHCRQFHGVSFPLFNRREDARAAFKELRSQGHPVEFANCRPYVKTQ